MHMFLTEIANLLSYCRILLVSLKLYILVFTLLKLEACGVSFSIFPWLGGQAKTLMFVHIAPEPDAIGESISTLKFAERVATVELGAAKSNKEGGEVKELKEQVLIPAPPFHFLNLGQILLMYLLLQIACLKAALAKKDGETESIRSTQSSPDIYRMRMGSAPPAFRNLMEEVGNLEVFPFPR